VASDGAAESEYSVLMWRHVDVLLGKSARELAGKDVQQRHLVPDLFHGNTPQLLSAPVTTATKTHRRSTSVSSNNSGSSNSSTNNSPQVSMSFPLLQPSDLRELFDMSKEQYKSILSTELLLQHPETAIRELQLRLLCLDNNQVYNKDTFIVSPCFGRLYGTKIYVAQNGGVHQMASSRKGQDQRSPAQPAKGHVHARLHRRAAVALTIVDKCVCRQEPCFQGGEVGRTPDRDRGPGEVEFNLVQGQG